MAPAGPPGQISQGGAGPTPLDQQRLQQVQEEIRRRRALRQTPQTAANTPGGPQPMSVNPGDPQVGPQLLPANPANAQGGPVPMPANPSATPGGPQPMPVPNKP